MTKQNEEELELEDEEDIEEEDDKEEISKRIETRGRPLKSLSKRQEQIRELTSYQSFYNPEVFGIIDPSGKKLSWNDILAEILNKLQKIEDAVC